MVKDYSKIFPYLFNCYACFIFNYCYYYVGYSSFMNDKIICNVLKFDSNEYFRFR